MVNVYVLGGKDTPDDNKTINEIIPWTLEQDYNVLEKKQIICGDLIDDTTLLYDRLSKDPDAWLIVLTDEHIRICERNMRDKLLKILKDNPDKSAFELFSKG